MLLIKILAEILPESMELLDLSLIIQEMDSF